MEKKYIKALAADSFDHQLYIGDTIKIYGEETIITGFSAQYNDGTKKWETIIHTIGRGDPFERSLDVIEVLEDQPRSYEERSADLHKREPIFTDQDIKDWEKYKEEESRPLTGPVWVKASDRLPQSWNRICARFIHTKNMVLDPEIWLTGAEERIKFVEWLDESPIPSKESDAVPEWVEWLTDRSPHIPDLSELDEKERQILVDTLFQSSGLQFLKLFYAIGLNSHMESGIVEEESDDLFRLRFELVQKGNKQKEVKP